MQMNKVTIRRAGVVLIACALTMATLIQIFGSGLVWYVSSPEVVSETSQGTAYTRIITQNVDLVVNPGGVLVVACMLILGIFMRFYPTRNRSKTV